MDFFPILTRMQVFWALWKTFIFTNVLGDVFRSRREGQTGEDFRQDIFEMRLQRSTKRYPSGHLRAAAKEHEKISIRKSSN